MTRIIRYGVLAIAVVVCAWFVIGVRQVHAINDATNLLNNASTERSVAVQQRARSLLDEAAFLYPGVDVTLLRAQLAGNARDYGRAARLLDQATTAEPDNIHAWVAYLELTLSHPSSLNANVLYARLRQLDPLDVPRH
jgi:hypothetical protein